MISPTSPVDQSIMQRTVAFYLRKNKISIKKSFVKFKFKKTLTFKWKKKIHINC